MNRPVLKMTLFALSCFALSVELAVQVFRMTWKQAAAAARKRHRIRLEQSLTRAGYAEPRVRVSGTNTEPEEQPGEWFGGEAGLLRLRNRW